MRHATAGQPESRLCPARTLDGGAAVGALTRGGPALLISAYRDGRIRAHPLPYRAVL
ncbi:hypothetical protein [Streptomyces sp. NPDC019937]|uniref:hypothetical protein n=1 Tax=Streptomyces sp. NPDC019937 TaxID=3154787 RepID=UPI0033CD21A4